MQDALPSQCCTRIQQHGFVWVGFIFPFFLFFFLSLLFRLVLHLGLSTSVCQGHAVEALQSLSSVVDLDSKEAGKQRSQFRWRNALIQQASKPQNPRPGVCARC